ncbi:glycosyltransferase family 2 protein [Methylomonas sp. MgM2]
MTFQVSAVIVNYNAGELLRLCIESLVSCPLNVEVVIVDNASSDGSLDTLCGLERQLKIIRNDVNRGFAAGCNQGLAETHADYILFINPDCSFVPGALQEILAHLKADSKAGMAGGLLVNPDGTEQVGGRRAVPTPWRSFVRMFGLARFEKRWPKLFGDFNLHQQPLPEKTIEVEAISGACMLVKRKAVDDVGLWDEGYFLHCEDLDWCMRFRQKGWKVLFIPSARVVHEQGTCGKSRPIFVEWHKHKGMLRFYRKFFQHQYPGILMGLVIVGVWLRFFWVAACYLLARIRQK